MLRYTLCDETTADINGSRLGIMAMCKTIPQIKAKPIYTFIINHFVSLVNRYWKIFQKNLKQKDYIIVYAIFCKYCNVNDQGILSIQ